MSPGCENPRHQNSFLYTPIQEEDQLSVEAKSVPVVTIEMWQGRPEEHKERLIKGITRAFEEIGVKADVSLL
jgi:hypothetical protein